MGEKQRLLFVVEIVRAWFKRLFERSGQRSNATGLPFSP